MNSMQINDKLLNVINEVHATASETFGELKTAFQSELKSAPTMKSNEININSGIQISTESVTNNQPTIIDNQNQVKIKQTNEPLEINIPQETLQNVSENTHSTTNGLKL